ncbi:MAG: thioredoxin-related protein [Verrucomicrobiaceae bacterium]|nr:thioredoxin-related protein [Verrucomicrobiaceae bacterium]
MLLYFCLAVTLFTSPARLAACGIEWLDSLEQTTATAAEKHRPVLLFFTGSDWSPRSMTLDKQVFEDKPFAAFVSASFSLFQLDFPQRIAAAGPLMKTYAALAEKHGVSHFPTLLALRPDGTEIGRLEYNGETAAQVTALASGWLAAFNEGAGSTTVTAAALRSR